ncbi:MAG TPA: universal stress protein [Gemmatimonadaceae bacterium]|nr:universal stress protein [Gemmatimonadaceae bacterium]
MYEHILVPLEHSPYDAAVIEHVQQLARMSHASLVLIHVADGWAARNIHHLNLQESEEMRRDRAYLESVAAKLEADGFEVEAVLASGDPAQEIVEAAEREQCDLIAMATHGHRFLSDLVRGSVATAVRHRSTVPVLMVRGQPTGAMEPDHP